MAMDIYIRRARRASLGNLLITFVLGLGIGLALGYSWWGTRETNPSTPLTTLNTDVTAAKPPEENPSTSSARENLVTTTEAAPPTPAETASLTPMTPAVTAATTSESPALDVTVAPPPEEPAPTETPATPAAVEPGTAPAPIAAGVSAGRHLIIAIPGATLNDATKSLLGEIKPGGVLLREENIENRDQTIALIIEIKSAVGMGSRIDDWPLIAVEHEGGQRNRLRLKEAPSAGELGSRNDLEFSRAAGRSVAEACAARGIGVLLAPALEASEPDAEATAAALSFGTDPVHVAALGLAFADGVMEGGVIPVLKHYPGQGTPPDGAKVGPAVLKKDTQALARVMYPFSEAVSQEAPGMMVGHTAVPALEMTYPDRPASMSPVLVRQLLRERWKYGGVIVCDDLESDALADQPAEETSVAALSAGCDALILSNPDPGRIRAVCTAIAGAQKEGRLAADQLDASRKRLETWQAWLRKPTRMKGPLPALPERTPTQVASAPPPAPAEPNEEAPPTERPVVENLPATTAAAESAIEAPGPPPNTRLVEHAIQPGEALAKIARKYGVKQADVIVWNNLADENIKFGRKLKIYVAEEPPALAPPVVPPAPPTPEAVNVDTPPAVAASEPAPAVPAPEEPSPADVGDTSVVPAPAQPPGTVKKEHVVVAGQALADISAEYGVAESDILAWNALSDATLPEGKSLTIYLPIAEEPAAPGPKADFYTVHAGDTLGSIAGALGVSQKKLMELNDIENPRRLRAGQRLKIPSTP